MNPLQTSYRLQEGPSVEPWSLVVGDTLSRLERMSRYGGARYGGIEPSARTPNVFVYSDPSAGEKYGYNYDGWVSGEALFLYTGEGRVGDQEFKNGNRAILDHQQNGRALRVFVADGKIPGSGEKIQRYVGEFELDRDLPYVRSEALDVEDVLRTVIVFRLRPVADVLRRPQDSSEYPDVQDYPVVVIDQPGRYRPDLVAEGVALEIVNATEYGVSAIAAKAAVRREAGLVDRLRRILEDEGHQVGRFQVRPPGEMRSLYTDLFDFSENVLYEAKASAAREVIRMAIGQLLDYSRFLPKGHSLAVLLPSRPAPDLVSLLASLNVRCICEEDSQFVTVTHAS
jgi:hypothetical protein